MFLKKGTILLEIEAKQIKLCYMNKGEKYYFEKIELDHSINIEHAVKGYKERHGINPPTATIIVKSPEVKARYRKLEGAMLKTVDKAVMDLNLLNIAPSDEKMIADYEVVDVCDGNVYVLWAAMPEKIVMDYVKTLKNLGIIVERVDIYHNCVAKNFRAEKDKELLIMFRYFDEATVIHLRNGIVIGIKDIMFDYDDPPADKLFNSISSGFSWMSLDKVYIINKELDFAKGYFAERGIACEVLEDEDTEFIGIKNLKNT